MSSQFPKDVLDTIRTCILSIFWPKKDIISFFENNGCSESDFKGIKDYREHSRSQIVDIVFNNLNRRNEVALGPYRRMLKSLIEWSHFDPFYFNDLKKLDINNAKSNITLLKQLQEVRDYQIKKQREKRKEKEEILNKSEVTLQRLKELLINLHAKKDKDGQTINNQKRGYEFENFLRQLISYEGLGPSSAIKIKGEQIDGYLKYDGENYIFEAKWQNQQTSSDALYHFAHKIDGKLYGRGIFISYNGFSEDSLYSLTQGKPLKLILIDGQDLTLVVEGLITFKDLLNKKIKAAQTMGKIYVNPIDMRSKVK